MEHDVEVVFDVKKSIGGIVIQCIPAGCKLVQGCKGLCLHLSSLSPRLRDFQRIFKNLLLTTLILTLVVDIRLNALFILSTYRDLDSIILNIAVNWVLLQSDSRNIDVCLYVRTNSINKSLDLIRSIFESLCTSLIQGATTLHSLVPLQDG